MISRLPEPVGRACEIPNIHNRMVTAVDCTIVRLNASILKHHFFKYYSQSFVYLCSMFLAPLLQAIQRNSVKFNAIQFRSIPSNAIQFSSIQFNPIQFNSVQPNPAQFHKIEFSQNELSSSQFNSVHFNSLRFASVSQSVLR